MTAAEKTRLLAERVMGCQVVDSGIPGLWVAFKDGNVVFGAKTWSPLTNLAHAGEVLEAMRAEGWLIKILVERDDHIVELTELQGNRQILTGDPVLPTAICHAALMANGVKEEEL